MPSHQGANLTGMLMQENALAMGPALRHDPQCTSSSQGAISCTSPEASTVAKAPSGKGGLHVTSEQQQQLQQQHSQQHQAQQQVPQLERQHQQGNAAESSASADRATTNVPILSFEIDDAEGPLEGASNGLASQFGCLKVGKFSY